LNIHNQKNTTERIRMSNELNIPADHPTSVIMHLQDAWGGGIHCPFCGVASRKLVDGEYEPVKCDHLVCFEQEAETSYASDRLIKVIEDSGFSVFKTDDGNVYAREKRDLPGMIAPSGFAGIIPHAVSFHMFSTFDGTEWAYCYAPNTHDVLSKLLAAGEHGKQGGR
jgi:hypothetical protein